MVLKSANHEEAGRRGSAVALPLGMFISVASDQRFLGYIVCVGRGHTS